jgi:hypothetical protein
MNNFIKYNIETLVEIENIVKILDDDTYIKKIEVLSGSSIGQHIRHIVEFYVCLFSNENFVNYDDRKRDVLIENSPMFCLEVIEQLKSKIQTLDLNRTLTFKHLINNEEIFLTTNYARELIYLAEHSIHHFALIKIGIQAVRPSINLNESFGIAASTIKYRENNKSEICVS